MPFRQAGLDSPPPSVVPILIAEDHGPLRQALRDWLTAVLPDCQVFATDLDGVLSAAEQRQPAVVLLGFGMQAVAGLLALSQIHRGFPKAHIIVLAAYDSPEQATIARHAGADAVIAKDDAAKDLLPALRAALTLAGRSRPGRPPVSDAPQ